MSKCRNVEMSKTDMCLVVELINLVYLIFVHAFLPIFARRVFKHAIRKSYGIDVVFGCRVCIDSIDNVPHCSENNGVSWFRIVHFPSSSYFFYLFEVVVFLILLSLQH